MDATAAAVERACSPALPQPSACMSPTVGIEAGTGGATSAGGVAQVDEVATAVAAAVEVPHKHVHGDAVSSTQLEHRHKDNSSSKTSIQTPFLRLRRPKRTSKPPFSNPKHPPPHSTPRETIVLSERPAPQWTVTTYCVRICPAGFRRRGRKNNKNRGTA